MNVVLQSHDHMSQSEPRRLDIGTKCRSKYDLQKNQDPSIWACAVSAVCWWAQAKFGLSQWYYKEQLSK